MNATVAPYSSPDTLAAVITLEAVEPEPRYLIEFESGRSVVVAQSALATVIYVPVLDEGTDTYRPVPARPTGPGSYEILPDVPLPPDEVWAFPPGSQVRCEREILEGHPELVATALASSPTRRT